MHKSGRRAPIFGGFFYPIMKDKIRDDRRSIPSSLQSPTSAQTSLPIALREELRTWFEPQGAPHSAEEETKGAVSGAREERVDASEGGVALDKRELVCVFVGDAERRSCAGKAMSSLLLLLLPAPAQRDEQRQKREAHLPCQNHNKVPTHLGIYLPRYLPPPCQSHPKKKNGVSPQQASKQAQRKQA